MHRAIALSVDCIASWAYGEEYMSETRLTELTSLHLSIYPISVNEPMSKPFPELGRPPTPSASIKCLYLLLQDLLLIDTL
jgi:hypothetical protein